jgi:type IV pilus assembly protein PilV
MARLQPNGFSLIEVLVSLLVLTLGVIGVAGMQLAALRTAQQSTFQTTALQLASEMADRMRANDSQMKSTGTDNQFLKVDYTAANGKPTAPAKLCYDAACNAEELARFDVYEWQNRIRSGLPAGRAVICRDASPWDTGADALTWDCQPGAGDDAPVVIKIGWSARGGNPDGSLRADRAAPLPPAVAITVKPYIQ